MADLTIDDIALRYGDSEILKGVSVAVPPGKVVALLGPSGSGKTTLLRAVAGLERPYRGAIRIGKETFFDAKRRIDVPAEARGLGLVFQSYALWPHRTVRENVAYGLELRKASAAAVKLRVAKALGQIGQQQRVALARALVYEPSVILLDEPLSNLDAKLREEARAWLRQLIMSLGISALLVTHDQIEAMAIADRITLLNTGRVEQEGPPTELYQQPATLFAAEFMGNNNRLDGTLMERADNRAVIEVMGTRLEGVARTRAAVGEQASGVIRLEKVLLGGGAGANRVFMQLKAQMYIGERWELVFVKDGVSVRAYTSAPLKHEFYHVEFPPSALWIF
jgi:iron(III) transport system ATP-binding protein